MECDGWKASSDSVVRSLAAAQCLGRELCAEDDHSEWPCLEKDTDRSVEVREMQMDNE